MDGPWDSKLTQNPKNHENHMRTCKPPQRDVPAARIVIVNSKSYNLS